MPTLSRRRITFTTTLVVVALLVSAPPASAADPSIVRLAGPDRYSTAVEVSQHHHPGGAATVIVASGVDFPDAVAGAALAARLDAPLLLTQPTSLPQVTHDEIDRLDPAEILLLGGPAAVSQGVFDQLDALASTTRLSGPNRYATAAAISQHTFGPGEPDVVVIASGADFPDALAGAPLTTALNGPMLLTPPNEPHPETMAEIDRLGPDQIIVLGGVAAISSAVFDALDDLAPTTRVSGANRYATATAVSEFLFGSAASVYVAAGVAFPDALSGAAAAAAVGAPVLLTEMAALPGTTSVEIDRLSPTTVLILGGTSVVGLVPEHRLAFPDLPALASIDVALVEVVDGFALPVFVTFRPGDDRVYVLEQGGRILSMNSSGGSITEVLDIESEVLCCGERGLLGLAFDPTDPSRMFVHYSRDPGGDTVIEEYSFELVDAAADPNPVGTILTVAQPDSNHNGGTIAFGPDGLLYVALGDGGGGGDTYGNGQDADTLLGAILRLDVSTAPYAIPPGNPFADGEDGAPEVWAYGLRNPWRVAFDGADLYVADVGQGSREEISLLTTSSGGANLGWPVLEGTLCYDGPPGLCASNDFVDPIHEYTHGGGRCSITGGFVYRGAEFPDLEGAYFFGDYCTGQIMAIRAYQGAVVDQRVFPISTGMLTSFGLDGDGRLYATSPTGGTIYLIEQTA